MGEGGEAGAYNQDFMVKDYSLKVQCRLVIAKVFCIFWCILVSPTFLVDNLRLFLFPLPIST